uniref:3'-5' exonuclease domain-containing protein n=1 Tax=Lotus japonicus TaxID=34305 RepID=I3SWT4_LOTJA|nr:unknown [Lotus japonicus]
MQQNYNPNGYMEHAVTFNTHTIQTLFTSDPSHVDSWLSETTRHRNNKLPFIVGLDIEWRPNTQAFKNNPVALLQLCVDHRCLVFQIIHAPSIPDSLSSFLSNPQHTFVGVGIQGDVDKLLKDRSFTVANAVDLRTLAAEVYGDPEMMKAGLKALTQRVLGMNVEKPKKISTSKWDDRYLSVEQVQYAAIDAFVSFEIERCIYSIRS